jgi:hypothetical protein
VNEPRPPYAADRCHLCGDPIVDHDAVTGCVWCNCRDNDKD